MEKTDNWPFIETEFQGHKAWVLAKDFDHNSPQGKVLDTWNDISSIVDRLTGEVLGASVNTGEYARGAESPGGKPVVSCKNDVWTTLLTGSKTRDIALTNEEEAVFNQLLLAAEAAPRIKVQVEHPVAQICALPRPATIRER